MGSLEESTKILEKVDSDYKLIQSVMEKFPPYVFDMGGKDSSYIGIRTEYTEDGRLNLMVADRKYWFRSICRSDHEGLSGCTSLLVQVGGGFSLRPIEIARIHWNTNGKITRLEPEGESATGKFLTDERPCQEIFGQLIAKNLTQSFASMLEDSDTIAFP